MEKLNNAEEVIEYNPEFIAKENARIEQEYRRRENEIDKDLYASWQPSQHFISSERKFTAASLLHKAEKFPRPGDCCLEIGYGKLGWLGDMVSWSLRETDLYGIELDAARAAIAREILPNADLRMGDATNLPWEKEKFQIVILSTVFSSILDNNVRKLIADEVYRVLALNGVVIWYDLAVDNPKNPNVKGLKISQIEQLFPKFDCKIKSVTLAPPITRFIAPKSLALASILNIFPFLRTHYLGLLIKK